MEVGKNYKICLKPNLLSFNNNNDYEKIVKHKFLHSRCVFFIGYDTDYKYGESFIFCDKNIKLIENLKTDDDFAAFQQMTNICISSIDKEDNWIFHIVKDYFEIIQ